MSKRGGRAAKARKASQAARQGIKTGKTGSRRNNGTGFHKIPIAGRVSLDERAPVTISTKPSAFPRCHGQPMTLITSGTPKRLFWACRLHDQTGCENTQPYTPTVRTGYKPSG